ncbi:MAG: aldolase/citrate lyase family protein [Pseudomonadota bacterium]
MIDLLQITNDPAFARRCDALDGIRLFVDLERTGKAERQAGRNTFISTHEIADVGRIKSVLSRSSLMVRVNPLHAGTAQEVDAVINEGADMVMLPMFTSARQVLDFCGIVGGRVPVVPLLETAQALACVDEWAGVAGLGEIFMGLNDLHLSLGLRFMFEPLASGLVERVSLAARHRRLRFGFGGIARVDEGLLPGRDVLAEHLRLGSRGVILSRTFNHDPSGSTFEKDVAALRTAEAELVLRTPDEVQADALRIAAAVSSIASGMGQRA